MASQRDKGLEKVGLPEKFYLLGYNAFSPLKINRRFGGTYRLDHQVLRIRQARKRPEACNM
jgi:hypothetical protein